MDANMIGDHYILVKGKIRKVSLMEWARWMEVGDNRRVDYTVISDDVYVSTVFLGLDHNFSFDSHAEHFPILFETMIFRVGVLVLS